MKQAKLNLQHLKLSELKLAEYNPRIITEDEFSGLNKSISTFGLVENIVVNKDMTVVGGHQRIRALLKQGYESVDCNVVDLDKHNEKKLNVILNSHAVSGKYDESLLSEILEELKLDDDYAELRLDVLEPLDLSDRDPDLDFDNIGSTENREKQFKTQNVTCPNCDNHFQIQI